MRYFYLFLLLPSLGFGAGWTDIHGKNGKGEEIIWKHVETVTEHEHQGGYSKHVKADISIAGSNGKNFPQQDCLHTYLIKTDGQIESWLSCSPQGNSPLAGATFHSDPTVVRGQDSVWTCIKGCGELVPRTMTQDRWE